MLLRYSRSLQACNWTVLAFCVTASNLSIDTEDIQDLKRLCAIFEHVEKLITLAASLYPKFMNAPRLLESIFNDCYNFYAPRMGTVSTVSEVKKVYLTCFLF